MPNGGGTMPNSPLAPDVIEAVRLAHLRIYHHDDVVEYLFGRGIGPSEIGAWRIGYWADPGPMPALHERIVFPVYDFTGTVLLAVSGRVWCGPGPKYWHTRFNKKRWLYGLWQPATSVPVLVEGMGDCIALRKLGLFALATMGTALTETQAALLALYSDWCLVLPHHDAPHIGEQWRGTLAKVGVTALLPLAMYPAGCPPDADPDWMIQECPGLLQRVTNTLLAVGAEQFGGDPCDKIMGRLRG